jgi:hypothetical protein
MIVPDSITWPEPTMIRALVIATSCALAALGAIHEAAQSSIDAGNLFIGVTL